MRATTDLTKFTRVLPYASELFGVYTPLIGWKSKRQLQRFAPRLGAVGAYAAGFKGAVEQTFNADGYPDDGAVRTGERAVFRRRPQSGSLLLSAVADMVMERFGEGSKPTSADEWRMLLDRGVLDELLQEVVRPEWLRTTTDRIKATYEAIAGLDAIESRAALNHVHADTLAELERESALAGALSDLADRGAVTTLDQAFFLPTVVLDPAVEQAVATSAEDPFLTFDPHRDVPNANISPLGIVNLFRQYFFEFDTFLGSPVGHVWLSPGSSVELLEVSTRKQTTEKTVETEYETTIKTERATTDLDELSEAVKNENKDDTKLGFSTTVKQSWGTGSAEATGKIDLDHTQTVSREDTHKRMRQQSDKLSSEIREKYKTTFRTVTETTDTSSKRYLLSNTTEDLLNYEMRRKMRQVGVQVQDVGSYLCWQTFIDEPGAALGLGNLVHIAKPADLVAQPSQKEIAYPPRLTKPFQLQVVWDFDSRQRNNPALGFIYLAEQELPVQAEPGYEIERPPGDWIPLGVSAFVGEDAGQPWAMGGRLSGSSKVIVGVIAKAGGIDWDERVDITVVGEVSFVPTAAKKAEIDAANSKITQAAEAATREQDRAIRKAFTDAARERIQQAAAIVERPFEDLREEERTVVYRSLINSLMTDSLYKTADARTRHVLSELITAVFDVDKMLYFVAPEWWKPRAHHGQFLGSADIGKPLPTSGGAASAVAALGDDALVNWANNEKRPNDYLITDVSKPARMGASLGWLLQLDGDRHRNAFLNAPWVKAVIPVRPGKERVALNWLRRAGIEGSDGLDAVYDAATEDRKLIRDELLAADAADPVSDPPTIGDAIRHLCLVVERKNAASTKVSTYPEGPGIVDDDRVSATPVERVFEHGFYPLEGGFRPDPAHPDPDPHNTDKLFQIFDQWIEILPTDQVVPVPVAYDPITGQQK